MKNTDSINNLIGNTPLVTLSRFVAEHNVSAKIVAKLESQNPGGSIKDRIAAAMIADAEARGTLRPGSVIIEPTSGNTGIGLAYIAAIKKYRLILTMPDTMSKERRQLLVAYGAELVLTEGAKGMKGAIAKAHELAATIPDSFIPAQFQNPANPAIHHATTAPEIWHDSGGEIDIFIAGVGTGGTITGVGSYLRKQNPNMKIIAVEPAKSPILSGGTAATHGIQGIGAGFIPEILDVSLIDEIITVKDEDAIATCRAIAQTEGLLTGISSGAVAWAALSIAKRMENTPVTIAIIFPDGGERYLSMGLYG
ncbi:MAG: cysteine synthase A [Lachnospiraceae bacterium]|jgi:cysteine synthase A|nr:cysteine synthase A [Lachnospiraceae bacterium]